MNKMAKIQRDVLAAFQFVLRWIIGCAVGLVISLIGVRIALPLISVEAQHGNTLTEFVETTRDEEIEYCAFFDESGRKLLELAGDECSVCTPSNLVEMLHFAYDGELTEVHNHPAIGSLDFSFSLTDLLVASVRDVDRTIVVAQGHNFVLEASDDWPSVVEILDYFETNYGLIWVDPGYFDVDAAGEKKYQAAVKEGLFIAVQDDYDGVSGRYGSSSELIAEFAEYFGLFYTVEVIVD